MRSHRRLVVTVALLLMVIVGHSSPVSAVSRAGTGVLSGVVQLGSSGGRSCALISDGTVRCWGQNRRGVVLGSESKRASGVPVTVQSLTDVVQIAVGNTLTCALRVGGTVSCWGVNLGQLGFGVPNDSAVPVQVVGLSGVRAIAAGGAHACAIVVGGAVKCWGQNRDGQLGNGKTKNSSTPVAVDGITGATQISSFGNHTCVVIVDGSVRCWGSNVHGQLGAGFTSAREVRPISVSSVNNVVQVSVGVVHTCALVNGGTVWCWGYNGYGALGIGGDSGDVLTPAFVPGLSGVTEVASGSIHTCAAVSGAAPRCWGRNDFGALGDGTTRNSDTPVEVVGLGGAIHIAAGHNTTCASTVTETAVCWGANWGALGNGSAVEYSALPVSVVAGR